VLLLRLAPKSSHITPILKSFHWLDERIKLSFSLLPTVNLAISSQPYLFSTLSYPLLICCQPSPHWKSQIAHSVVHRFVCEINFQIHSVSLASLVTIHLLIHLSTHLCHHHHALSTSITTSFFHSRLKPTSSTNPSHLNWRLVPPTLHSRIMGLDWTYHAHRYIFSLLFIV